MYTRTLIKLTNQQGNKKYVYIPDLVVGQITKVKLIEKLDEIVTFYLNLKYTITPLFIEDFKNEDRDDFYDDDFFIGITNKILN